MREWVLPLKQSAISVKTIVIKGAAPKSIKGLKILFASQ